jgi:hypothetical protein
MQITEDAGLDTPAISRKICPGEVVSIQSEIDYRSTLANSGDTGGMERAALVSNYEFQ